MSKIKTNQPTRRPISREGATVKNAGTLTDEGQGFQVPYPLLWLGLAVIVVYFPTLQYGLTDLDDTIFIRDFHEYNEQLGNLITSFQRGLFDAVKDPYYRPLFMDSMILNYQLSDHGLNVASYHWFNLAFHITSVFLLFGVFRKLQVKELHAFLLCLVFAVHPVLSQAVAWIPGRNDTMLAIFVLSYLIYSIDYSENGKIRSLLLAALFLLLAYFTKETAVFAAPVALVLIVFVRNYKWNDRNNMIQYAVWTVCFITWYLVRAAATVQIKIGMAEIVRDFIPRLPLILQYLGKVILPFNLSVFPIQQDTVIYFGLAALVILAAIVYFNKQRNMKTVLSGLGIFLLFLLPVLFVPAKLNEQSFEHRLYLPVIGILLLLSQTSLLINKLKDKQLFSGGIALCALLAMLNFAHHKAFEDKIPFWTQAVETSPHSAFANMMLAARLDKDDFEKSCSLFRTAYNLNPNEKYLNFYYGVMLQKKDSVKESEKYLLAEKNGSGYYECDFYLARCAMEKRDPNGAITYLSDYLKKDPANSQANNNLILLYFDTQQPDKAKEHIIQMQKSGLTVSKEFLQKAGIK